MSPDPLARVRLALALAGLLIAALHGPPSAHADTGADTLCTPAARVRAWQVGLARPDRLGHASLSFTLAAGAGLAGGPRGESFAVALALGTLKECWDIRRSGFDPVDLTADVIGAALGARAAAIR